MHCPQAPFVTAFHMRFSGVHHFMPGVALAAVSAGCTPVPEESFESEGSDEGLRENEGEGRGRVPRADA